MKKILNIREVPVLIALVVVVVITSLANPAFFTASGAQDVFLGVAVVAFLAVGQSLVITMRHVDLSVGSTVGLTAFLIGFYTSKGASPFVTVLIALGVGLAVGAVNGFLIAYLQLPSLVVTLGTMYVVRGIFNQVAGGFFVTESMVPKFIVNLGLGRLSIVPTLFIVPFFLVLIVGAFMRYTRSSRDLYAIGSNPPASKLVGIPVARRTFLAFLSAGAIAGLGGVLLLARFRSADSTSAMGLELNVIAACVVGGVAIAGGIGTVYGALIGALLLQTITLALGALGVGQFWQLAVNGALLIAAISLDRYLSLRIKPTTILRVKS